MQARIALAPGRQAAKICGEPGPRRPKITRNIAEDFYLNGQRRSGFVGAREELRGNQSSRSSLEISRSVRAT